MKPTTASYDASFIMMPASKCIISLMYRMKLNMASPYAIVQSFMYELPGSYPRARVRAFH